MKNYILFVHIPKTAGTSFRIAAENYFKKENTYYDYGRISEDTSPDISKFIYKKKDFYGLYRRLTTQKDAFLSGHFAVNKYMHLFDTLSVVSFVREPVAQVISHYNHYCAYYGYTKTLIDFIDEPRFQNIQSKYLQYKPISLYGFIGLTEEYDKSIELFNFMFKAKLKPLCLNVKQEGALTSDGLSMQTLERIKKKNHKDMLLYERIKEQFYTQYTLYKNGLSYTYSMVQKNKNNHIVGFACQREHDKPIMVDIYNGTEYLDTCFASELKPGLMDQCLPRRGYIGFDYEYHAADNGNVRLKAIVQDTEQNIL